MAFHTVMWRKYVVTDTDTDTHRSYSVRCLYWALIMCRILLYTHTHTNINIKRMQRHRFVCTVYYTYMYMYHLHGFSFHLPCLFAWKRNTWKYFRAHWNGFLRIPYNEDMAHEWMDITNTWTYACEQQISASQRQNGNIHASVLCMFSIPKKRTLIRTTIQH